MKNLKKLIPWPVIFVLMLFSCRHSDRQEQIYHIQQVFVHGTTTFLFKVRDPVTDRQHRRKIYSQNVTYVRDVPEGQEMWADYYDVGGDGGGCHGDSDVDDMLTIHLRATAVIEGGGRWGCSGRGNDCVESIE